MLYGLLQTGFRPMVSVAMGADILEYPPQTQSGEYSRIQNLE